MIPRIKQLLAGVLFLTITLSGGEPVTAKSYNPNAESTVQGTIESVSAPESDTVLALKTRAGKLDVLLGPSWFVSTLPLTLRAGGPVQIIGCRMVYRGTSQLVARELRQDRITVALRDETGKPLWTDGR